MGTTASVLLLSGATLFARSLYNLRALNPGFSPGQLLGFSIDPSLSGYSRERSIAYFVQLQDQAQAVPDVQSAAISVIPLMTDSQWSMTVRVEGYTPKEGENMSPYVNAVGPGYFATMNQALLAGREFTLNDVAGAPKVAIVNQSFVRKFKLGSGAVGKHFSGYPYDNVRKIELEIVGVVADAAYSQVKGDIPPQYFQPRRQSENPDSLFFYVGTGIDPAAVMRAIPGVVSRIDRNLPVHGAG